MKDDFSVLIQNRTEFEKGNPAGVFLSLPATKEELHEAMKALNITADNRVFKFKTVITFNRLKFNFNTGKLTGTAGLFLVGIFNIGRFGKGFTISDLRFTDIRVNFKFTFQAVNNNFQVQLAHTFDNGLSRFLVG